MNELVNLNNQLQAGAIIVGVIIAMVGFLLTRNYYRRTQIQQITKMSKEFRVQQVHWEDQRKGLEEDAELARADLRDAHHRLDELRREHNRQSAEWQENQHQLSQRVKQLYQLVKKREREKNEFEKQLALGGADWRREREELEHSNTRLRQELEARGHGSGGDANADIELQCRDLREQLVASQSEVLALQRQISDQSQWAEQVQRTLEEEVVQLNLQLERYQTGSDEAGNVKSLVR